jgi:two-component system response regulator MprA
LACLFIVDDEELILRAVQRVLARAGHRLFLFSGAGQALAGLGQVRPDVVMTDYHMPACDGVELLRRTRALDPGIGRVLATAGGRDMAIEAGLGDGTIQVFLEKPWRLQGIEACLEALQAERFPVVIPFSLDEETRTH